MRLSKYGADLSGPEKARYLVKVRRCDGVDPLDLTQEELVLNASLFPRVQFTDIKDYLVNSTSFLTRDQLKSLEAHNYLTSGWVQEPLVKVLPDGNIVVVGKVRHSQSIRDALLRPWLLIKPDGEVQVAHCTCMSGLGEACSHVGAVLFYMEAVVRRRNDQACTDQDNVWLPPHVRVVDCVPIAKVDFSSSEMKKRKLDGEELRAPAAAQKSIEKVTKEEWEMFMERCHQSGSRPALLLLSEKYAHEFVPLATKFPSAILSNLASHDPTPAWEELVVQCAEVANSLAIEPQVAALIQEQTTEQAGSTKWFSFRAGRITASNARTVCKTSVSQPSQSLLKKICHPMESQFWSPAVAWGRNNEPKARQAYEAKAVRLHEDFSCRRSGLHISSKHPFLGATPDGLIDCSCCGPGVLEVKCPYTFRDNFIKEMPGQKYSCLCKQGDDMMLLEDHIFYYQNQTQMLVCNREYCDFVVWTSKEGSRLQDRER